MKKEEEGGRWCGVWGVGCGVWGVGCGVWGVGCGVWDSKQVYWRAEGWLVKGRLAALASPPPHHHPLIPPLLPLPMSPLGSLMDPDRNCCPPSPNSSSAPPHPCAPQTPPTPSILSPSVCPLAPSPAQLWPLWPRFGSLPSCGSALSFFGGAKRLSPGCQKHIRDVICHPSTTINLLWTSCASQRYRQITACLCKDKNGILLRVKILFPWLNWFQT